MQTILCSRSFELTDAIARHVERRTRVTLGSAADQIRVVSIRLADINGSHGGIDKRCRMAIWLHRGGMVVAEAVNRDLYAAVSDAAQRAGEAVRRSLKRRLTLRREYAARRPWRALA